LGVGKWVRSRDSAFGGKAREEGEFGPTDELKDGGLLAPPSSTAWGRLASDDVSGGSTAASRAA
jgi:hypothetical protein